MVGLDGEGTRGCSEVTRNSGVDVQRGLTVIARWHS